MRLLLDTVTFIWAVNAPQRLSQKALAAMQSESTQAEISAVSLSEIAIKNSISRLDFGKVAVEVAVADMKLRVISFTAAHAFCLFDLPLHHKDPFDRQIVAQAMTEDIPIVTCDKSFTLYKGIKVLW